MKLPNFALGSILFASLAMSSAAPAQAAAGGGWQCAPFARVFSGIQLFGNAYSWWAQAIGKYAQGTAPKVGSVMVFKAFASMRVGHVATVSQIVSERVIKVTHANWSTRGQVERDVRVVDVSPGNDWSQVKVWYAALHDVGQRAYPVYGFIYQGRDKDGASAAAQVASSVADEVSGA